MSDLIVVMPLEYVDENEALAQIDKETLLFTGLNFSPYISSTKVVEK